jgi:coenzyme F420-0:L-glutamate ligase / coenzyme F420-1:gamma-L-glutamate ligase
LISARALHGLPEVRDGDDLAALISALDVELRETDVVAVAHKVVSKAEGRVVALGRVSPGERAQKLAREHDKDARVLQVVLDESAAIVRSRPGVLICRTHHGFVCANAGVDASNAGRPDAVVLLPRDPDHSARALRAGLRTHLGLAPAVIVTDSFGRAWRHGQCEVAIGIAGLQPIDDWRGRHDSEGRELHATAIATADEAAAAADLARTKDSREPVVVVSGLDRHVTPDDGPGVAALLRPPAEDLFL